MDTILRAPEGLLTSPDRGANGTGVLVLAGSSGRVDVDRARVFAHHGAIAISLRWFGSEGQPPGICEVPLETFASSIERLASLCDRVVVVGSSKGGEAALLLAAHDPRVNNVIAFAASNLVWANLGAGIDGQERPYRSCWTVGGNPIPFVPYDDTALVVGDPPAFRTLYAASIRTFAERIEAATIRVEKITGEVLLVAGGDDQVWPSLQFATAIAERRSTFGLTTTLRTHPLAGHRTVLPGEQPPTQGTFMARGGTTLADAELGQLAWPDVARICRFDT